MRSIEEADRPRAAPAPRVVRVICLPCRRLTAAALYVCEFDWESIGTLAAIECSRMGHLLVAPPSRRRLLLSSPGLGNALSVRLFGLGTYARLHQSWSIARAHWLELTGHSLKLAATFKCMG